MDPLTQLPPEAYTPEMSHRVYETIYRRAENILGKGYSVIADAVFSKPAERGNIEAVARRMGVPFTGLWLEAEPDVLIARVSKRCGDASDADADVVRSQLGYDTGQIDWQIINTGGSPDTCQPRKKNGTVN